MPSDKLRAFGGRSRRSFIKKGLQAAGGVSLPLFIPASALGRDGHVAPSNRITMAGVGIGPRGRKVLAAMLPEKDVQFVGICDVQRTRRASAKAVVDHHYDNKDCWIGRDMFEVFERRDIDAVLIATGDRWHALASILAMKAGKDVYSEKPCALTIREAQALDEATQTSGRIFQVGTQRRSLANFQYAVDLAQSGRLGQLRTLYASVYTPSQRFDWLPEEPQPDIEEVDWNRWLGRCPWRPYNRKYVAGRWRGHYDFEGGATFLDWGAHTVDLCQWANQSDDTTPISFETTEAGIVGMYENGVKLVCDFLPTPFGDRAPHYTTSTGTCPVRFEGDEGSVETGDQGEIVLTGPVAKTAQRSFPPPGTNPREHARNFFDCVKSRAQPICNSKVMRRSHIACFAAAMSWELGRKVRFDPAKERFIDDDEANERISRPLRDPWTLDV